MISVKLKGQDAVKKKITALGKRVRADVARQVTASAFNIDAGAKRNVRVDTGRLRSSINAKIIDGGLSATVGSNVSYAADQEFGIPGRRYSFTPYLYPAFLAERESFLRNIKRILTK